MSTIREGDGTRVNITGMGTVTPFGVGIDSFWDALAAGRHAFAPIHQFPTKDHRTNIGAEIRETPSIPLRRLDKQVLSRADHLALAAALEALEHACLLDSSRGCVYSPQRAGLIVGTAAGAILGLEEFFRKRILKEPINSPFSLLSSFALSAIATNIAKEFQIQGQRMTIATVCSSSGLALAAGMELLETKEVEFVLVVGTETLSEVAHGGFNSLRSVAPERCQPFDLYRKGLVLGEGAGAMVLERSPSVKARKVSSLGYLSGYGLTTDLHHFTAPEPEGHAVAEAVHDALTSAGIKAEDIEYVNAHGTGTSLNDVAETRGLKKVLGDHSFEVAVSSTKSMIGHTLGAASILEAIATVLSLQKGIIPPTCGLEVQDSECDLDYTPKKAVKTNARCAVSNSLAFGGSNISLVFSADTKRDLPVGRDAFEESGSPVITGIGVVSPIGIGRHEFNRGILEGRSGLSTLPTLGDEWAGIKGGVIDMAGVLERTPSSLRRRSNRQACFLFLSLEEAMADAGLGPEENGSSLAVTYGTAFGCSSNVHRFFSQIVTEGARFSSPQEFNMSVTNAPPSLVAQALDIRGPIWVFVADEASWEVSLHWAAGLIQRQRRQKVVVSASEELSHSILAIHNELGILRSENQAGLELGEGSVSMVLESYSSALDRGIRPYGALIGFGTVQDTRCGPLDYSQDGEAMVKAVSKCVKGREEEAELICITPENGHKAVESVTPHLLKGVGDLWPGRRRIGNFKRLLGESGISGGLGLAAVLLDNSDPFPLYVLVTTSARGGINGSSLVKRYRR